MKSHRDEEDGARDPRKLIAQLGTTGDELARTLGLDKDAKDTTGKTGRIAILEPSIRRRVTAGFG